MKRPKKLTSLKEDAGKLLQDLGKLIFAAFFLGGILRGDVSRDILIIGGLLAAVILCITGLFIGRKEIKNGENGGAI